jgi:hypothetical protein
MTGELRLGVKAYARRRGVTPRAVRQAIQSGRLRHSITRDATGNPRIDPDLADTEWAENTDHGKRHSSRAPAREKPRPAFVHTPTPAFDLPNEQRDLPRSSRAATAFMDARAIEKTFHAKKAQLDYEVQSKRKLDADAVALEFFSLARATRDAILAIPSRIAAEVAAMGGSTAAIEDKLRDELTQALEAVSARCRMPDER